MEGARGCVALHVQGVCGSVGSDDGRFRRRYLGHEQDVGKFGGSHSRGMGGLSVRSQNTDLDVLMADDEIDVTLIHQWQPLSAFDVILLAGSKSVMSDFSACESSLVLCLMVF